MCGMWKYNATCIAIDKCNGTNWWHCVYQYHIAMYSNDDLNVWRREGGKEVIAIIFKAGCPCAAQQETRPAQSLAWWGSFHVTAGGCAGWLSAWWGDSYTPLECWIPRS